MGDPFTSISAFAALRENSAAGWHPGGADSGVWVWATSRPSRRRALALAWCGWAGLLSGSMPGIIQLATYFPRRRLARTLIAQAWGSRPPPGSRTVAAVDEDALTMAVDATLACVGDSDPSAFDALFFASTSAPYLEKQVASVVATAIDLPRDAAVADFGGSARASLAALRAACDAVRAGSLARPLVVAADVRPAEPGSELEAQLGDGAACAAVGGDEVIAELVSAAAVSEQFTYAWRTDG